MTNINQDRFKLEILETHVEDWNEVSRHLYLSIVYIMPLEITVIIAMLTMGGTMKRIEPSSCEKVKADPVVQNIFHYGGVTLFMERLFGHFV